jgi:uncharacterized protein with NRDE domain
MSQVAEKGCTVRIIEDSDTYEPTKDPVLAKVVYSMRGLHIVEGSKLWPDRTDVADVQVAMGEMYCRGGWHATRTSKIIRVDHENGLVETLNSVYRSIDGRLA